MMITDKQLRLLLVLFAEAGVRDRDERLAITGKIIGRTVNTSLDMSIEEASVCIDQLKQWGLPSLRKELR